MHKYALMVFVYTSGPFESVVFQTTIVVNELVQCYVRLRIFETNDFHAFPRLCSTFKSGQRGKYHNTDLSSGVICLQKASSRFHEITVENVRNSTHSSFDPEDFLMLARRHQKETIENNEDRNDDWPSKS